MRRTALALLALCCLLAPTACSTSSGSKEKFCAELPKTGDVMGILGGFDTDDSAALEKRFDEGLAKFRALEKASPREIRSDVADLADAVQNLLTVVRKHPDDLAAIRKELAGSAASFVSAGKAAARV